MKKPEHRQLELYGPDHKSVDSTTPVGPLGEVDQIVNAAFLEAVAFHEEAPGTGNIIVGLDHNDEAVVWWAAPSLESDWDVTQVMMSAVGQEASSIVIVQFIAGQYMPPVADDDYFNAQLGRRAKAAGVAYLDRIVVSDSGTFSFRSRGLLGANPDAEEV